MLTAVEVTNAVGGSLLLPVLSTSSYPIREITGLDPVNAALISSSLAQVDGAQFQNARRETRNINMKLGFEPNFITTTVASLRSSLYDFFMPKANITLGFYIDEVLTYLIAGQVESFENAMFSADPAVDISIICYDPDFYAPEAIVVVADTVDGTVEVPISYEGTSDCGLIFEMTIDHDLDEGFALYNTPPANAYQGMIFDAVLLAGDIITINTIPGQKSVTLNRDGSDTSLLYGLLTGAVWLFFHKGVNYFRVYAEDDPISYSVTYVVKYGGI